MALIGIIFGLQEENGQALGVSKKTRIGRSRNSPCQRSSWKIMVNKILNQRLSNFGSLPDVMTTVFLVHIALLIHSLKVC